MKNILCIGDSAVNIFIRIKDASLHCDLNKRDCEICFKFAQKIPYSDSITIYGAGNSANASVSFGKLGIKPTLISNLGDDIWADLCKKNWRNEGVNTSYIKENTNRSTNIHYVLWFEDDRTILTKHEDYKYEAVRWPKYDGVYLSSLGNAPIEFYKKIEDYLEKHKETRLFFQPGSSQLKMGYEKLKYFYERADIISLTEEECALLLQIKENKESKELSKALQEKTEASICIVTDGAKGAIIKTSEKTFFVPAFPEPQKALERTGAGDAFASTFIACILLGKDIVEAGKFSSANAMNVTQHIGPHEGLLKLKEIEELVKNNPDYKVEEIDN